ncbi:hypothetical protein [Roseovarius sp.]|uniref:hypothetical protein n=1 Tax=Roseovarius sp. TaxID=1486281 RepID=UPI003BA97D4D
MSNQTDHTHNTEHDRDHTYIERTEERRGGGTGIALLVGGLIVAVGVLFWAIYGGFETSTTGGDVDVNVESSEGSVDNAAGAVEDAAGAVEDAADTTAGAAEETADDAAGAADAAADDAAN